MDQIIKIIKLKDIKQLFNLFIHNIKLNPFN